MANYQITDENGTTHTSNAKSHKGGVQILHRDGKSKAFWFKSFEAACADRAKFPDFNIEVHQL